MKSHIIAIAAIAGSLFLAPAMIEHANAGHGGGGGHMGGHFGGGSMGHIGGAHFGGGMGHIDGAELQRLQEETAPEVADRLASTGVDYALLIPA